jgi:predicted outer membrane repeat protein
LDTINVPAGVYQITRVGSDDTGLNGDLDVSESVTIQGAGSLATIIDGNGNVTNDRVFHIRNNPNANTVTLNGLTVRDGKPLANGIADNGGGIFARVFRLVMNDVRIENNSAARGGGLYSDNCELFINGLVVASNNATVGAGGGIWAQMTIMFAGGLVLDGNTAASSGGGLWADNVQIEIRDSRISDNNAQLGGGGLMLSNAFRTKLDRTELFANIAGEGGALNNATSTPTTLTDCSVHNNHATVNGGAIHNVGALALVRTTVRANSAAANGGGIMIPGLNFRDNVIEVRVENSTLSGNTAQFGGAVYYNETDDPFARHSLVLRNSTVAANRVSRDGAGIYTKGIARVFASSATIAANVLQRTSGSEPARGGGVFSIDTSYVSAENTIIGDNFFRDELDQTIPDDIYTAATTSLRSTGYNLIETTTNYTLTGSTVGCIFGLDPQLDPAGVAENGGPTPTLACSRAAPRLTPATHPPRRVVTSAAIPAAAQQTLVRSSSTAPHRSRRRQSALSHGKCTAPPAPITSKSEPLLHLASNAAPLERMARIS